MTVEIKSEGIVKMLNVLSEKWKKPPSDVAEGILRDAFFLWNDGIDYGLKRAQEINEGKHSCQNKS